MYFSTVYGTLNENQTRWYTCCELLLAQRASISSKIRSSKSSSEHRARLTTTLCLPLKTVIGQSSDCVLIISISIDMIMVMDHVHLPIDSMLT